jgi:small subunit ribosomal protein S1
LSIKAAQQDPWVTVGEEIQEGQLLTGNVVRILDFGAFVRLLPGIDGLVHVSEIQDERIAHPRDVLKEGDEVKVRVVGIDPRRRRISLTMRIETGTDSKGPRVGETVEGIPRAHKPYGVFIDLPSFGPRTSGLLPLEEAGVAKPSELAERFPAGDKVKVLVQQIDERGRIRLAIPSSASGKAAANLGSRGVSKAMADALRKAMERSSEQKK